MFDKFGEFNSVEELNEKAAELKAAGDEKELIALAEENGIDKEDAEDYMDGGFEKLATPFIAAVGKLELEAKKLALKGGLSDWKDCIIQYCSEDEAICRGVRQREKTLAVCLGQLLKFGFDNKQRVHDEIIKAAGLKPPIYMGIPAKAEARKIIREYYMK